jgi:4-amino-4-deoxy-L-arabinose transferase-like glycosyltransferase
MKWQNVLLIAIVLLALCLRFYKLEQFPISLNLDEVAIGYNAYSILKTGQDEYGTPFPLAFRSHDDFKASVYIYATTIPIALFGLNGFSVRFFSALAGVFAVLGSYYLVKELVKNRKEYLHLPLLVAFFLAISPWHLQYSRPSFEVNVATTMIIWAVWAYLKGFKKRNYWYLSAFFFVASIYTYHSTKLFVPMFLLILGWHARVYIKKYIQVVAISAVIAFLTLIPLLRFSLTEEGQLRFSGTSVFNTPTLIERNNEQLLDQWRRGREYQAKIFHNKYLVGAQVFMRGYFSHFTYDLLFFGESGPPKNYTPNVGLLYLWELPFILIGSYQLFRKKFPHKEVIIAWLLLSPIAAGLTWDFPSTTRTTTILPTWQILTALGVLTIYTLSKARIKYFFMGSLGGLIIFFFCLYLHNYYRIAPLLYAEAWQYGYEEAVGFAEGHLDEVDRVVVSTALKQPQNFFAFYSKYDPQTYIESDGGTVSGGFNEQRNAFGKYEFHSIDWNENELDPEVMYIGKADDMDGFLLDYQIDLPNGDPTIGVFIKKKPLIDE